MLILPVDMTCTTYLQGPKNKDQSPQSTDGLPKCMFIWYKQQICKDKDKDKYTDMTWSHNWCSQHMLIRNAGIVSQSHCAGSWEVHNRSPTINNFSVVLGGASSIETRFETKTRSRKMLEWDARCVAVVRWEWEGPQIVENQIWQRWWFHSRVAWIRDGKMSKYTNTNTQISHWRCVENV